MRWDHLFDDLESQLEQELGAEDLDLLAEEERLRLGRLTLRDRLREIMAASGVDRPLRLVLVDGSRIALSPGAIGRDWLAGELQGHTSRTASCVVPFVAIAGCLPDAVQVAASTTGDAGEGSVAAGSLGARLGLAFVLRDLCRRRIPVRLSTLTEQLHGTIDRVGRDHLDLAEHDPDVARRDNAVHTLRILPTAHLVMLRF
jgi:hypothetical protein